MFDHLRLPPWSKPTTFLPCVLLSLSPYRFLSLSTAVGGNLCKMYARTKHPLLRISTGSSSDKDERAKFFKMASKALPRPPAPPPPFPASLRLWDVVGPPRLFPHSLRSSYAGLRAFPCGAEVPLAASFPCRAPARGPCSPHPWHAMAAPPLPALLAPPLTFPSPAQFSKIFK